MTEVDVAAVPLLGALSPSARDAIAPLVSTRRVRAGEPVFDQDAPAEALYYLRKGEAEVVRHALGHELSSSRHGPARCASASSPAMNTSRG